MWQLSGGNRLFGRANSSAWHVSPHTPPDLELGAMSPMSYSTSEPSQGGAGASSPSSTRSASPLVLPTRSLVDNSPRANDAGYCTPTGPRAGTATGPGPLTQMLRRDLEAARAEQTRLAQSAAAYRAQALGVAALLQTYDVARLYPALAGLQQALRASEQAGAPAQVLFLTPTCVFGACGLGVLAPPSHCLPNAPRRSEALALGIGCVDDTAAFMGQLAKALQDVSTQQTLAGPAAVPAQMLTNLHAHESVLSLSAADAATDRSWPWAQAVTQAVWVGVGVGLASWMPRLGAAAGVGTLAYRYGQSVQYGEQVIQDAWRTLAVQEDDEGYGSALGRTNTGQSSLSPKPYDATSVAAALQPLPHVEGKMQ